MPTRIVAALVLGAWGWCLAADTASQPAVELGRRYFNLTEGYSLCPPTEADRIQERVASRTVTWIATDKATGGLEWVLSATRVPTEFTEDQLQAFVEQTRQEAKQTRLSVESCQVTRAAGRPAIDLRGLRTDRKETWTRQVSILAEPGEFLTLTILGPPTHQKRMFAVHQAVLDSVELLDRRALIAQREANLTAGRALLAGLTAEKLLGALDPQDRWTLILRGGQAVGFSVTRDCPLEVDGRAGVESHIWMRVNPPDGQGRTLEIVSFAAADRTTETWTATLRPVPGEGKTPPTAEPVKVVSLTKQGPTIHFRQILQGADQKPTEAQRVLAEQMDRSYLPMAMQSLVTRLVDLAKPASYAFASYAPKDNELDVYTVTVVASEEIELNGRKVEAFRALVRPAEDVEEEPLWVDSAGRPLRQQMGPGEFLEQSTREEVLRRFPAAGELLKAIDAATATQPSGGVGSRDDGGGTNRRPYPLGLSCCLGVRLFPVVLGAYNDAANWERLLRRAGIITALVLGAWVWCPAAQTTAQPGVELGKRYFNLAEGYSLCPPAGANRVPDPGAGHTVVWAVADQRTGAAAWVLAAARMSTRVTEKDLKTFAEKAFREGREKGNITVESCEVIRAAGRPAVDLRGSRRASDSTGRGRCSSS